MHVVNKVTGLAESWNEKLNVPVVHQRGLARLSFDGSVAAVHTVPMAPVPSLDFYANLSPAPELYVSLHGAVIAKTGRYPKFWRVASMKNRVSAFMSIADPTLLLSDRENFCLGWYVGGEAWDPLHDIAEVVRQAMRHVGAKRVMFLGGSGGGFASLRLATLFQDSLAFVQDPQTSVAAHRVGPPQRLAEAGWPGLELEEVLETSRNRLDMCALYRETDPRCFVYYRQSTGDAFHVKNHLTPFQLAIADTHGAKESRYRFVLEGGEVRGHGKITPGEFDHHFDQAVHFWRTGVDLIERGVRESESS